MIGQYLKQVRLAQHQTQAAIYGDLLSPREIIRVEQGTVELKASHLMIVLARLGLDYETLQLHAAPNAKYQDWHQAQVAFQQLPQNTTLQDTAALDFYQKYHQSSNLQIRQMAILAKYRYWMDVDIPADELNWLLQANSNNSRLTITQLATLIPLCFLFDHAIIDNLLQRLTTNLNDYRDHSQYHQLHQQLLKNKFLIYLNSKQISRASELLTNELANNQQPSFEDHFNQTIFSDFLQIAQGAPDGRNQLWTDLQALRVVGGINWRAKADGYLDYARQLRQNYQNTTNWTNAEIGVTLRLLATIPQTAKTDLTSYLKLFAGLQAQLLKNQRPLSEYLMVEPVVND